MNNTIYYFGQEADELLFRYAIDEVRKLVQLSVIELIEINERQALTEKRFNEFVPGVDITGNDYHISQAWDLLRYKLQNVRK